MIYLFLSLWLYLVGAAMIASVHTGQLPQALAFIAFWPVTVPWAMLRSWIED